MPRAAYEDWLSKEHTVTEAYPLTNLYLTVLVPNLSSRITLRPSESKTSFPSDDWLLEMVDRKLR